MPALSERGARLPRLVGAASLAALTLLLMRDWLQGGLPISPRQETIPELAITWMFRQELLDRRLLSEWNSLWFSGFPWLRYLSYPLYYVLAALSAWGGLSLEAVMVVYFVAVVLASGLAMFAYLRLVLPDWRAALIGAMAYVAFPYHNHVGVETWIHAAVWVIVPLFLWAVERWRAREGNSASCLLLAGAVLGALPIVSSEYTILVAPFLGAYLLARGLGDLRQSRVLPARLVGAWAVIGAVAIGISAFFVLPGLFEIPYVGIHAKHGGGSTFSDALLRDYGATPGLIGYAIAKRLHLPVASQGLPGIVGSFWSVTWYPGVIVLALASIGAIAAHKRFVGRAALVGLLLAALLSSGTNTPLNFFARLPVIGRLSAFRGMLLVVACLCLLAAFGAEWLLKRRLRPPLKWLATALLAALIVLDFAPSSSAYQTTASYFRPDERAAYAWLSSQGRQGRVWEVATAPRDAYLYTYSLSELPLARYGGYYDNGATLHTREQLDWTEALATTLSLHQVDHVLLRAHDARADTLGEALPGAGFLVAFEQGEVTVWQRDSLSSYARLYGTAVLDLTGDLAQAREVLPGLIERNVAVIAADALPVEALATVGERAAFVLAETQTSEVAKTSEVSLRHSALDVPALAPADVAGLGVAPQPESTCYYERIGYDRIRLQVVASSSEDPAATAPEPALLTIAESWYPHWRVWVDGQPAQVLRVNWALLGVWVEPGNHRIEFRYERPWYAFLGYAVTGMTLLGLVLWWATHWGRVRSRRRLGLESLAVDEDELSPESLDKAD